MAMHQSRTFKPRHNKGGTILYGWELEDSNERGWRLYHHSWSSGVKRLENKVSTVEVGRDPG